ncbi:unnamed protein product [Protopolystoma xenopodis]|uniref:Uncharacterized protein n=1 Tax=Protopolystoma xenopodis TaxID=117903 RepID=A0A448WAG0_9PLAT|nr:unnamed protein product [Protopolystoma xenopodis]
MLADHLCRISLQLLSSWPVLNAKAVSEPFFQEAGGVARLDPTRVWQPQLNPVATRHLVLQQSHFELRAPPDSLLQAGGQLGTEGAGLAGPGAGDGGDGGVGGMGVLKGIGTSGLAVGEAGGGGGGGGGQSMKVSEQAYENELTGRMEKRDSRQEKSRDKAEMAPSFVLTER